MSTNDNANANADESLLAKVTSRFLQLHTCMREELHRLCGCLASTSLVNKSHSRGPCYISMLLQCVKKTIEAGRIRLHACVAGNLHLQFR